MIGVFAFIIVVAFGVTIISIRLMSPLASRLNLVDRPDIRKNHQGQVPLVGGIGMFLGFSASLVLLCPSFISHYRSLYFGLTTLLLLGVLDDFQEVSVKLRVFIQTLVVIIIYLINHQGFHSLGNLFSMGEISLGYMTLPFTIIASLGLLNAINLLDGMDGLAGSVVSFQLVIMAYLVFRLQLWSEFLILLASIGSVIGFLIFNFPYKLNQPIKVFMGNSGSMFLGFLLVWLGINLTQVPISAASPITFLWIIAIPILDTFSVMYRRFRKGCSMFKADNEHLHHFLYNSGWNSLTIDITICGISVFLGLLGIVGELLHFSESVMFLIFLMLSLFYLFFIALRKDDETLLRFWRLDQQKTGNLTPKTEAQSSGALCKHSTIEYEIN